MTGKRNAGWLAAAVLVAAAGVALTPGRLTSGEKGEADPALERTRKQVRMLDDIYKGAIVLITTHYVDEEHDVAAGRAFKKLFQQVKEKGWHEVRLLDATGEPYSSANEPRDAFEKQAVKELLAGKDYYEQVVQKNGKPHLRAVTAIPVVMDKCIICHPNYKDVPKGKAIGGLAYVVPIE